MSARIDLPATVGQAEALWYDTARWPAFVDGLRRVLSVAGPWPAAGARVEWESHAGGRGRVVEQVVAFDAGRGQSLDVEDEGVSGRQAVSFEARGDGVRVTLALDYAVRRRSPLTPLVDALFIRRSQRESLQRTLARFGAELNAVL